MIMTKIAHIYIYIYMVGAVTVLDKYLESFDIYCQWNLGANASYAGNMGI